MSFVQLDEESIFQVARKIDQPEAREAYLQQACRADLELRNRVDALLSVHEGAAGFLMVPLAGPTIDLPNPTEQPEAEIGPYKLREQIGEGGMGVVYVAEQAAPVRRRVALKIIKPGMDSRQVIARFEAERQALAMMDHPNIARVIEAGATDSGRPFFVMELVHGIPITDYCDREQLTIDQRLDLFVLVCRAVQHAHQKGIIHRDLKPSNILVTVIDGIAVPKVIDFGIAKATGQSLTDQTVYTAFAQLVGTPLYMSPEQVELSSVDIDTRSDIYSLGVLLYELLTGTTPFDHETLKLAALDEIRRMIREEEPARPSTRLSSLGDTAKPISTNRRSEPRELNRTIRGELDWIVMKALEKDRKRRYETANDFASDVMRYLTDKPVEACPPSTWYRLRKLAWRNRVAVTAGVLVVGALLAGTAVATWQAVVARRALRQSDNAVRTARNAVDDMYTQVAKKWLSQQPRLEPLQREFLSRALSSYERLAEQRSSDPSSRRDIGKARMRVAEIQSKLGESALAEAGYGAALEIFERLSNEFPDSHEYRHDVAACYQALQNVLREANRLAEAEVACRKALALQERLVLEAPQIPDYRKDLADNMNCLALLYRESGKVDDAKETLETAMGQYSRLIQEFPTEPEYRYGQANLLNSLGIMLATKGGERDAERAWREALSLLQGLPLDFTDMLGQRQRVIQVSGNLSHVLSDPAEILELRREVVAGYDELVRDFPRVLMHRRNLAVRLNDLAVAHKEMDQPSEADAAFRRAMEIQEKLAAESTVSPEVREELAGTLMNFVGFLHDSGRATDAEQLEVRAVRIVEQLAEQFPTRLQFRHLLAGMLHNRALRLANSGRLDVAEPLARRTLELRMQLVAEAPQVREYSERLDVSKGLTHRIQEALKRSGNVSTP